MTFSDLTAELKARIPQLRGALEPNAPLKSVSWFRTGGPAQMMYTPADEEDLALFLKEIPPDLPFFVVGLGSNLLVRDGGLPGVAIRLGKAFADVSVGTDYRVTAGTAAPDVKVARTAAEAGVAGLSFLRGIPGSIGGALRMNVGAYGGEIRDIFVSARAVTYSGEIVVLGPADMKYAYRYCGAPETLIFTQAVFAGRPGNTSEILAEMNAITEKRISTQPVNARTGGSTFKNPPGYKAWELIEAAGCRGMRVGDAVVSEMHCNFLINQGEASAAEIEDLGEMVRRRVLEHSGIDLEWEIKRIGVR